MESQFFDPHLIKKFCVVSNVLASRGDDGSVRVWDIAGQLSQSTKMQTPIKCIPDLMNLYPSANVAFRYGMNLFIHCLNLQHCECSIAC